MLYNNIVGTTMGPLIKYFELYYSDMFCIKHFNSSQNYIKIAYIKLIKYKMLSENIFLVMLLPILVLNTLKNSIFYEL